jgi:catechol 2,3-dioxygenase-like lactoylglutathione lyase family enzyme
LEVVVSNFKPNLGPPVLLVEDLQRSKSFYQDMMGMTLQHEDSASVGLTLGSDMILLLTLDAARDLLLGGAVSTPTGLPNSSVFNLFVDDVDSWYERLCAQGVEFFIKPMDRSWGRRTAHLRDPDGWIWEISQSI